MPAAYVQAELDRLTARFPGYTFWHVPTSNGPDKWCWRPPAGTARDSQHRDSPEQAEAAILGIPAPSPAPALPPDGSRRWVRAARHVRALIENGTLRPDDPAPSAAALARATGYSVITCRRALRALIVEGTLAPGPSPGARPRVPVDPGTRQPPHDAARALSAGLAARRRAAALTQPQLAALLGLSTTTIGHAETGRLWQSRHFWETADKALHAEGQLLALHDACQQATAPQAPAAGSAGTLPALTARTPRAGRAQDPVRTAADPG